MKYNTDPSYLAIKREQRLGKLYGEINKGKTYAEYLTEYKKIQKKKGKKVDQIYEDTNKNLYGKYVPNRGY